MCLFYSETRPSKQRRFVELADKFWQTGAVHGATQKTEKYDIY